MAAVDVRVERVIHAPLHEVATYAADPTHAPEWYTNIESVEWRTDPPVRVGSEMDFVARFLGRRIAYTYRVEELVPGERLVMATAQGPFPMRTEYGWESAGDATVMTLHNTGEPSGFAAVTAPIMEAAMRRATSKDLARLAGIVERRHA